MIGTHFTSPVPTDPVAECDWVRLWDCGVTWKDIHLGPGKYDWSRLDMLMQAYAGKKILYTIAATPRWLAMDPDAPHAAPWLGKGSNSLPSDINAFNEFVWHLSTRYAGRIHAYEVWNEPQLQDFMTPYNTASIRRLVLMTSRARRTIKANDPAALVGSASVLPRPKSGGMRRASRYLRELKDQGWPVDFISTHIYPEVGTGSRRWRALLKSVLRTLKRLNSPVKKLWITETAYGLLGDPIPDAKAEQLVRDTYKYAGGRFVFWYAWNREDLGGFILNHGTAGWEAVKKHG